MRIEKMQGSFVSTVKSSSVNNNISNNPMFLGRVPNGDRFISNAINIPTAKKLMKFLTTSLSTDSNQTFTTTARVFKNALEKLDKEFMKNRKILSLKDVCRGVKDPTFEISTNGAMLRVTGKANVDTHYITIKKTKLDAPDIFFDTNELTVDASKIKIEGARDVINATNKSTVDCTGDFLSIADAENNSTINCGHVDKAIAYFNKGTINCKNVSEGIYANQGTVNCKYVFGDIKAYNGSVVRYLEPIDGYITKTVPIVTDGTCTVNSLQD